MALVTVTELIIVHFLDRPVMATRTVTQ
jgi:hypothetical protein